MAKISYIVNPELLKLTTNQAPYIVKITLINTYGQESVFYSVEMKIDCTPSKLGFEYTSLTTQYNIGSEALIIALPNVVHQPKCLKVYNTFKIKLLSTNVSSNELVAQAVTLESQAKLIRVSTDDYRLANTQVKVVISFDQSEIRAAENFTANIDFKAPVPEFNTKNYSVKALSCTEKDKQW